jgi:cytochrome c biogenesis protein CcdA
MLASLAGVAMLDSTHWLGLATALCFAAGHVTPLLPAAVGMRMWHMPERVDWRTASEIVSGGVLLSLGAYYALLA